MDQPVMMMRFLMTLWVGIAAALLAPTHAAAHELDPGYLDLRQLDGEAWQVFWRKPDVKGKPMTIDARLPETCTPATGPEVRSDGQAWSSHWTAICAGGLAGQAITIDGLDAQSTDVLIRLQPLEGSAITTRLTPTEPFLSVPEKQTAWGVFWTYAVLGFEHILEGWDHLAFVLALVLLIRDARRLVGAITAFTVAHSITLALAALGHLSIPGPPVEAIIALSVVFLAIEMLKHKDGELRLSERAPWMVAFAFGLLHGLGFAGALREIGLPDGDIALALLAFNVGVEAGQLAFVAVILVAGYMLKVLLGNAKAFPKPIERGGTLVAGYAIGCMATYLLAERLAGF